MVKQNLKLHCSANLLGKNFKDLKTKKDRLKQNISVIKRIPLKPVSPNTYTPLDPVSQVTDTSLNPVSRVIDTPKLPVFPITETPLNPVFPITETTLNSVSQVTDTLKNPVSRVTDTPMNPVFPITDTPMNPVFPITETTLNPVSRVTDTPKNPVFPITDTPKNHVFPITDTKNPVFPITDTPKNPVSRVTDTLKNPVFPITDSLIQRLLQEDREKFSHLGAVYIPSLNDLVAGGRLRDKYNRKHNAPVSALDLSKKSSECISYKEDFEPIPVTTPIFSRLSDEGVKVTSLPPIKRWLAFNNVASYISP